MNRDHLEHAIRAACQIIQGPEVIVVGSQAILGTFDEDVLPREATMSRECDILPIADMDREGAERQHGWTYRAPEVHRLVPRASRPVRCEAGRSDRDQGATWVG